jgi:hypothetical protein
VFEDPLVSLELVFRFQFVAVEIDFTQNFVNGLERTAFHGWIRNPVARGKRGKMARLLQPKGDLVELIALNGPFLFLQ